MTPGRPGGGRSTSAGRGEETIPTADGPRKVLSADGQESECLAEAQIPPGNGTG